jgi:hypothetical protein
VTEFSGFWAFSGLLCDRAMIRIAFQSSPIRSLPFASAARAMSQSDSVAVCVKFSKGRFGKSWKKGEAIPAERAGEFYK